VKTATENTSSNSSTNASCNFSDNNDMLAALKAKMEKSKNNLNFEYKMPHNLRAFFDCSHHFIIISLKKNEFLTLILKSV
jgi:hypothetical protein